jgi:OPA family glycerol-3-phosphate transporter-like MFS transporter
VNGFAYIGSGIQSYFIGHLVPGEKAGDSATFMGFTRDWHWLPLFVMPFAIIGTLIAIKIWHDLPPATRKYIAEVEQKKA